jgi:membrane-associated phospholipid phosphatase
VANALATVGRRYLPRGWADLGRQLAIWFGFYVAYQLARGAADRDSALAFENGLKVIDIERRLGSLFELSLQGYVASSEVFALLATWTYWLSQFAVLGLALLWVYLRRTESFFRFRNTVLIANLIGLVGYVFLPTAPPRMFPDFGFVDTLAVFSELNHSSAAVEFASNPYAAMPSLHAADALIVGVVMALIVRRTVFKALWLAWPAWVWFTVMATGNHFWLDIAAGVVVAGLGAAVVYGPSLVRRRRAAAAPA